MDINLLPWLVAWAIPTTVVVILVLYRAHLVSHEVTGIRIDDTEADDLDFGDRLRGYVFPG